MTRVIKLGGRVQSGSHALPGVLAAAWQHHRALVVVHGGGDEVSRAAGARSGVKRSSSTAAV